MATLATRRASVTGVGSVAAQVLVGPSVPAVLEPEVVRVLPAATDSLASLNNLELYTPGHEVPWPGVKKQ